MAFEVKKLQEELGEINQRMSDLSKLVTPDNPAFTPEQAAEWDSLEAAADQKRSKIETAQRIERMSTSTNSNSGISAVRNAPISRNLTVSDEDRKMAFRAMCLREINQPVPDRWASAADKLNVRSNFEITLENRGLDSVVAGSGGNLVNSQHSQQLERVMKYYGGVMDVCKVLKTGDGNVINWPVCDDTGNSASIVGQNTASTTTDLAFTTVALNSYKIVTTVFPVSYELLQDSFIDVEGLVVDALGERLGRYINNAGTVGTGTSQPQGVVPASTLGRACASATVFTWQEVIDLIHSVDISYRKSPNFALMMHDSVLAYIRKLADTTNQPLFLMNLLDPNNPTFLGYKIIVNNDMPSTFTTTTRLIVAGDFSKHIVRISKDINVTVLRERYADQLAAGFLAYARVDSRCIQPGAIKHLRLN